MDNIFLKYKPPYLYEVIALIASVLLALFTYLQPGDYMEPGLDASWNYGMNYVINRHLVMGKEIYFTFGPLGFLEHTIPLSLSALDISSRFWFACSIVAFFLVLVLCREAASSKWQILLNIILALVLIFFANTHIQRLLIITYTCIFLHWCTRKDFYLLLMAVSAVICLMIKFSYGAVALALYLPYLATITWRDTNLRCGLTGLVVLPLVYLLLWFCIYGTVSGSIGYIIGGLEFSRGSTSAMALNPANNWPAIGMFFAAFICAAIIASDNNRRTSILFPLCFLGPLFIWSKYAFGREDAGHLAYLMSFVFYLGLLWIIFTPKILHKFICFLAVCICFFTWKQVSINATSAAEFTPHYVFFKPVTFKYRWNREEIFKTMRENIAKAITPLQLDPEMLATIGNKTVDIYPWETVIAAANNLNWSPRPSFQSYLTYTPFLDRKNFEYYQGKNAPEFILWHYHSYQDIDNRYPFSSDPLTLQAIFTHYRREICKGSYCLWRHTDDIELQEKELSTSSEYTWNTWINLPTAANTNIVRAHIDARRTLLGKLNMVLWKEGGIEIDYRLKNNDIKTHTLIIDNATSGIWASPYLTDKVATNQPELIEKQAVKQLLAAKAAEGYIEKAELTSQGIHIAGWGLLPFKDTKTQQLRFLLTSDTHAYMVTAQNRSRVGITEYFKKTGIVDLDFSGFDEVVDTHGIAPGKYQLHFVVTNEGATSVHTQLPAIILDTHTAQPESSGNVAAIRLRTTRPWAFTNTFSARWSALTFSETTPW
jgi:hypothetical protein